MAKRDKVCVHLPYGMNTQLKTLAKQLGCSVATLVGRVCQERLELANLWPPHNLNQPRRVLRENPRSLFSQNQIGLEDKLPADAEEAKFMEESKALAKSMLRPTYDVGPASTIGDAVAHASRNALEITRAANAEYLDNLAHRLQPDLFKRGQ
jgi:hypothetical protein